MLIYRIGTRAHPIWDGAGAAGIGGRWNEKGLAAIYAAGALSLAMLERLVQRVKSSETLVVEATAPDDMLVEDISREPPAGWDAEQSDPARSFGSEWLRSLRTPLLRVPSVIVPREANYVVNPAHPDARAIVVTDPEPLIWDERLFGIPRWP